MMYTQNTRSKVYREEPEQISYENASKLYRLVNYFSLKRIITRTIALMLVKEHPSDIPWTTDMFSWICILLSNPFVSDDEVDICTNESKHILYYYPSLLPMFRAYYHIRPNLVSEITTDKMKSDFPAIFEKYIPTLDEEIMCDMPLNRGDLQVLYSKIEKRDLNSYFLNKLMYSEDIYEMNISMTKSDLEVVYQKLTAIQNCGISKQDFHKYITECWLNILHLALKLFLTNDLYPSQCTMVSAILQMDDVFEPYGNLIVKHGRYARIANLESHMSYFLNIPSNVKLSREVLLKKFDKALSNLESHRDTIIAQNKSIVAKYIKDYSSEGTYIENKVSEKVYSYPTCELAFGINNNVLECHTRLDLHNMSFESYLHTCMELNKIKVCSPIDEKTYEKCQGFDIETLLFHCSDPEYHIFYIDGCSNDSTSEKESSDDESNDDEKSSEEEETRNPMEGMAMPYYV